MLLSRSKTRVYDYSTNKSIGRINYIFYKQNKTATVPVAAVKTTFHRETPAADLAVADEPVLGALLGVVAAGVDVGGAVFGVGIRDGSMLARHVCASFSVQVTCDASCGITLDEAKK
jgi:hypothetical protein